MSRAYLIDPANRAVGEVRHESHHDVHAFIGADQIEALQAGWMQGKDHRLTQYVIYVDRNGYFITPQSWFQFGAMDAPIGGRALLVGIDGLGRDADAPMDVDAARSLVTWLGSRTPKLPDAVHYPPKPIRQDQNAERERRLRAKPVSDGGSH